jgi:hypothetical protein
MTKRPRARTGPNTEDQLTGRAVRRAAMQSVRTEIAREFCRILSERHPGTSWLPVERRQQPSGAAPDRGDLRTGAAETDANSGPERDARPAA